MTFTPLPPDPAVLPLRRAVPGAGEPPQDDRHEEAGRGALQHRHEKRRRRRRSRCHGGRPQLGHCPLPERGLQGKSRVVIGLFLVLKLQKERAIYGNGIMLCTVFHPLVVEVLLVLFLGSAC